MGFLDNLPDERLLPTHKNSLAQATVDLGFSVGDFEWTEDQMWEHHMDYGDSEGQLFPRFDRQYRVSVLKHKPSEYYCRFGPISMEYSPANESKTDKKVLDAASDRLTVFSEWLRYLKREIDAPDLWASIIGESSLSTAASSGDLDNRPLTAAEQSLIAAKLDEIKGYVLEGQQFDAKQAEFVEQEFAYLKESSKRFGRKDWLRLLLSVLVGQVINLALAPEKAKGLLHLAGTAFQWVWNVSQGFLP